MSTSLDPQHLIKMVNQIGDFFVVMPDQELALSEIANHLRKFWAPSMRNALVSHFNTGQTADYSDIVKRCLNQYATEL